MVPLTADDSIPVNALLRSRIRLGLPLEPLQVPDAARAAHPRVERPRSVPVFWIESPE